jgi:hypothetical protein
MKLHVKRLFWIAVSGGLLFIVAMFAAGWRFGGWHLRAIHDLDALQAAPG